MIKKTLLISGLICSANITFAATPHELLNGYEAKSAKAEPARGEKFFNAKHGKEWSCASCHENPPNHDTKHIVTGKVIKPLSPNANLERFVDQAKADKWFKRNCNDVLARECTAQEKADVLAWLMAVK
jgi:cytochrome c553